MLGIVKIQAAAKPSVSDEGLAAYVKADLAADVTEIAALRTLADQMVEDLTGRAILNTRYRLVLPTWPLVEGVRPGPGIRPVSRHIVLPRSPLVSIESIKYYDENEVLQTLPADQYIAATAFEPGAAYLKKGYDWPALANRPDSVQVEFTAGYGEETEKTPGVMAQAIKLLARHFFSGGSPNIQTSDDGMAAHNLLMSQRVTGFAK